MPEKLISISEEKLSEIAMTKKKTRINDLKQHIKYYVDDLESGKTTKVI